MGPSNQLKPDSSILLYFPFQSKFCILPLISLLCLPILGWNHLPVPTRSGTKHRLRQCAGCRQSLSGKGHTVLCSFRTSGFAKFWPCGTGYHTACLMVGPPFHTRRKNNLGLSFPAVSDWPNFICEACTVRSVTKREITYKTDLTLLRLERMRLIDMSWYWAKGSYTTYGSKLRSIRDFEANFEVAILTGSVLSAPPCSPDIPLMWCIEANSTRLTTNKSHGAGISDHISFGTIHQL